MIRTKRLCAIAALLCVSAIASAGDVTVAWTAPTTCADDSAIANCPTTGFEISEGTVLAGAYVVKQTVAANVVSAKFLNIAPGQTRCYYAKTVSNALKSAESNRACVTVPFLPPKAPQGMTVTVSVTMTP